MKNAFATIFFLTTVTGICHAQFLDDFDANEIKGWYTMTGDGTAEMDLVQHDGYARLEVDATKDHDNVWWAIAKQDVSSFLDMEKLKDPAYELRVELRVRASHAPRRANIMINTQRTTNFHKQLREYDITDTNEWHTISMTTQDLDAVPGDELNVQVGITDWGYGHHYLDIDYYKADIVRVDTNAPDLGEPLVYHPPTPALETFSNHLDVDQDVLINAEFPTVNFHQWTNAGSRVLTVSARQWPILRWDLAQFKGEQANGPGLLELTTHSVARGGNYNRAYGEDLGIEFGKIRIIEVFGGETNWDQTTVTYQSFTQDKDIGTLINGQMIFDTELPEENGGKTYVTISRPVMQRLLDGTTQGLILRPLGAIDASLYDSEDPDQAHATVLHFNLKQ